MDSFTTDQGDLVSSDELLHSHHHLQLGVHPAHHQVSLHPHPQLQPDGSADLSYVDGSKRHFNDQQVDRSQESFVDPEWVEFVEKRHNNSCTKNCKKLNGEVVMATRLSMLERTKEERDLMLLAFISMLTAQGAPTKRGKDRKHWTMKYQFQRTPVCRETFLFAYGTTDKVLKSLMHHYKENGMTPRVHGNKGKKVYHSLSEAKVTTVVNWINNFASREGIPVQNPRGRARLIIPSTYTQRGMKSAAGSAEKKREETQRGAEEDEEGWRRGDKKSDHERLAEGVRGVRMNFEGPIDSDLQCLATLLPGFLTNLSSLGLHRLYVENCEAQNVEYVGRSTFLALWRQRCDHIAVAKSKKTTERQTMAINLHSPRKRKDELGNELTGLQAKKSRLGNQQPKPTSQLFV